MKQIAELSFQAKNLEEKKEKVKLDNEVKSILLNLKKQAIESFKDEADVKKFLDNMINFNNYSFLNLCLIWLQNPNAKYVASFKTFSKMGCKIKKDEVGMKILVPFFLKCVKLNNADGTYEIKPLDKLNEEELKKYSDKEDTSVSFYKGKINYFGEGNVFDISQTNMNLDIIELDSRLENPIEADLTDNFIKAIYKDGYKVRYDTVKNGSKGFCDFENRTIVVSNNLSNLARLKVIIHEYAHALSYQHLQEKYGDYKEYKNQYDSETEANAYTIAKYLKIDTNTYAINYFYTWSKEKKIQEIEDSFKSIVNNSKRVIKNYENICM